MTTRSSTRKSWNRLDRFHIESSLPNERGIFNIIENGGSGNCLFLPIFDFIENNKNGFKNIPNDATHMRVRIVDYIFSRNSIGFQENWDRFYGNLIFNLDYTIKDLFQYDANDEHMIQVGNCGTQRTVCGI